MTEREVGRRIRDARQAAEMTQGQLGRLMGVTHAAISDIERGKTRLTLELLEQLAVHLGTTPADLAEGVVGADVPHVHSWMPAGLFPGTTLAGYVAAPAFVALSCRCGAVRGVMYDKWEWVR